MAGISEHRNHGFKLAIHPGFRVLHFLKLYVFFQVPGTNNTDDLSFGRILIKFFQLVLIKVFFSGAGDDIHNPFPGFNLRAEYPDLRLCIGIAAGRKHKRNKKIKVRANARLVWIEKGLSNFSTQLNFMVPMIS